MRRYGNLEIQKDKMGKRFRVTTLLPVIPDGEDDIYIISRVGDRLDNLAHEYYGDSSLWWIIARASNLGKGDLTIPVGTQVRIPQDVQSIIEIYNSLNS